MIHFNKLLITISCVLWAGTVCAHAGGLVKFAGQMGGSSDAVAVSGTTAYVGMGQSLITLDINTPENPRKLGQVVLNGMINAITLDGDYAYVVTSDYGLEIVNISNPYVPSRVGGYKTAGIARKVAVNGSRAYLAAETAGVEIIDISTPSAPNIVENIHTSGSAKDVTLFEDDFGFLFAYIAEDANGLLAVDVTHSPAIELVEYATRGKAKSIVIAQTFTKTYAYIAEDPSFNTDNKSGLEILDISTPSEPMYISSIFKTAGLIQSISMADPYHAFLVDDVNGISVIDVSTPKNPNSSVVYKTNGTAKAVSLDGTYLYIANGPAGFLVLTENLAAPSRVGGYDTIGDARSVGVGGSYVYVADAAAGMQVVNVSNTSLPSPAGVYKVSSGQSRGVTLNGGYAYLANGSSGLDVLDVSTPSSPRWLATESRCQNSNGVAVAGNYAYVADDSRGLQVVDISISSSPQWKARDPNHTGISYAVALAGSYAYVADGSSGLRIVDISTPTAPQKIGGYFTTGNAMGIAVSGHYAYVADESSGLQVIDIASPTAPQLVGQCSTPGKALGVAVGGSYAYVADGNSGLQVIDISIPASPVIVDSNDTAGNAYAVAVSGGKIYVADQENGIVTFLTPYASVGSLHVAASPQAAVDAGAQWRRVGTEIWHSCGTTESTIALGSYEVEYKTVIGYDTPANEMVTINNGQTANISGAYVAQNYTLSLAAVGKGSISVNGVAQSLPRSIIFPAGSSVTLQAVPDDELQSFANWSGDLDGSSNPTSIQMDGNKSVTANFTGFDDSRQFGKVTLQDCSNNYVTFNLTGPGTGQVYLKGCDFSRIVLTNTNEKSVLTISTKTKTARIKIGDIIVSGSLKGINAKSADLQGNITVSGSLAALTLGSVAEGRTITIGGSSNVKAGVVVKLDQMSNLAINSKMPVKSILATEWLGGALNAPSVGTITIKGDTKTRNIDGDLDVDLTVPGMINGVKAAGTLSGNWSCVAIKSITAMNIVDANLILSQQPDAKIMALGKCTVKGWIDSSRISTAGNIGAVTAGAMKNASCFAGVTYTCDLNADKVLDLPDPAIHINYGKPAAIKKFTIKGIVGQSYCFVNSNIAAASILSAALCYPENANSGTPFGLSADSIKGLKIKDTAATTSYKDLAAAGDSKIFGDVQIRLY